jgi:hypothetical protein
MKLPTAITITALIATSSALSIQVAESQPTNTTTGVATRGNVAIDITGNTLTRFKGIKMQSGRQSRTPVSAYYKTTLPLTGGLELRTRCEGRGDTGMIVNTKSSVVINPNDTISLSRRVNGGIALGAEVTLYNDNHAKAEGNLKGSYICATCANTPQVANATVYVFSQRRETAYCALERKQGDQWQSLTQPAFRHYGGTLVDVGPLHRNDYVAVKTRDLSNLPGFNGSDYDSEMVLFNPSNANRPLLFNDNADGSRDPKITIPRNAWKNGPNYLLLGKTFPHAGSNKGV